MEPPVATDPPAGITASGSQSPVIITEKPVPESSTVAQPEPPSEATPEKLSKNALRRIRKRQAWEDGKDDRKRRRKEKRHERQSRKREAKASLAEQGLDPSVLDKPWRRPPSLTVPLALIVDCDFAEYMTQREFISATNQVTRCYGENKVARLKSVMYMAGFKGKLQERFTNVLGSVHKNWRDARCVEQGWVDVARHMARQRMRERGQMCDSLQRSLDLRESGPQEAKKEGKEAGEDDASKTQNDTADDYSSPDDAAAPSLEPEPEPAEGLADIIYLTSDSPYTLARLEPHTSYIIGGIVDKNRHKGLCYRRAREAGVRTAKLPIGQFMRMSSRPVLATNHVVEIMLKWLECEDWAEAFISVIPRRKGGVLRSELPASQSADGEEGEDAEREESVRSAAEEATDAGEPAEAREDTSPVGAPIDAEALLE